MCKIIDGHQPGTSKLAKVFSAASLYYNYSSNQPCFNVENETDDHGLHGWDWQVKPSLILFTCLILPQGLTYSYQPLIDPESNIQLRTAACGF